MTKARKFIISGCGRSGTTYMAKLLTAAGCTCSHELYFPKKISAFIYFPLFHRLIFAPYHKAFKLPYPTRNQGEAAWQAAPFLDLLRDDIMILHQVRHPLDFIRSRQKIGLIGTGRLKRDGRLRSMFTSVSYQETKHFLELSVREQVNCLARVWVEWNEMIEQKCKKRPNFRYRVEDLDLSLLQQIFEVVEYDYDLGFLEAAYKSTSKKTNTRGLTRSDISLDMLSESLYVRLKNLAARYGYDNL